VTKAAREESKAALNVTAIFLNFLAKCILGCC